ncbi:Mrp/NBP35 family ATP-binding protein [candidate division KSB1 bacterium]|nr:Mrp/NBP35 family ATP-binding protein [candidate division KSB1 bacterium]
MADLTEKEVLAALQSVQDPQTGQDLVARNMVKNIRIDNSTVVFTLEFKSDSHPDKESIQENARVAVKALSGIETVNVIPTVNDPLKVISSAPASPPPGMPPQQPMQPQPEPQKTMLNAKYTIAVASGKGGVGKTTVSVNLAVSLAKTGAKVGLLDADIYGPNIPIMMGVDDKLGTRNNKIAPLSRYGVEMVSVGFISQGDTAIIWRGPLVGRMIQQFLQDVDWGELDYLVIDLPPGTGDAVLTLTQSLPLTGAIVVSTPQDVAMADAKKGINMFKKVEVPILGIVENMSYFVCPHCDERTEIFDHGGGKKTSRNFKIPFLGEIPLETQVRVGGDTGKPISISDPDSPAAKAFKTLTDTIIQQVSKTKEDSGILKRVFKIS